MPPSPSARARSSVRGLCASVRTHRRKSYGLIISLGAHNCFLPPFCLSRFARAAPARLYTPISGAACSECGRENNPSVVSLKMDCARRTHSFGPSS